MPASATLVHSQQTTGITPKFATYRAYLLSFSKTEIELSSRLYALIDARDHREHSERLSECRTRAWFVRNTVSGIVRVRSNHCGLRWCPFCARSKAYAYAENALPWLRDLLFPRFMTLTLKHRGTSLSSQLDSVYDSFRRLRRCKQFKAYVRGGIWFFQVKKSSKTGQWHPHIHCLFDGKFFPHDKLQALWRSVTSDSVIVDVRKVTTRRQALDHVSRYVSRPVGLQGLSDPELLELHDALFSRRLCGSFGTAKRVNFAYHPSPGLGEWHSVGSWDAVMGLVGHDDRATLIYDCWQSGEPLSAGVDVLPVDDFIDDKCHSPPAKHVPDPQLILSF